MLKLYRRALVFYSPHTVLLPFIEQGAVFSELVSIARAVQNADAAANDDFGNSGRIPHPQNRMYRPIGATADERSPFAAHIDIYVCPSDPNSSRPSERIDSIGLVNYRYSQGDAFTSWANRYARGPFLMGEIYGSSGGTITRLSDAMLGTPPEDQYNYTGGMEINFGSVSDGLSNTLFFSERCVRILTGQNRSVLTGTATRITRNDAFFTTCAGRRGPNGMLHPPPGQPNEFPVNNGNGWGDGRLHMGAVYTILPPNSPTCTPGNSFGAGIANHSTMASASSYHTGGVNGALGDGSVRFISETIDAGDISVPHDFSGRVAGASAYGTWGAIGSRAGGESRSL